MLSLLLPALLAQRQLTVGEHFVPRFGSQPAYTIRLNNTTVDLTGFELSGSRSSRQEGYTGVGLLFDHCKNLVVKNGKVHGYRINVLLRGCQNVRIEGLQTDFSHAFAIRSPSGQPIERFLNLRDVDEWTKYGAGIWLHDCSGCHLVRCSAHHAMNGAILVTCQKCTVYNCDFSYNSAWGLALWRSSFNRLLWNHLDFCNRPWSGGWGGDASDMVVVSDSNNNLIVGNSMTHGGDGFFLADRVEGGWSEQDAKFHFADNCKRNAVWKNDGSYASANAFEATFSEENLFGENEASDSTYGFWLGYSSNSLIASNHIDRNDHDGIAIEHGHSNQILSNFFDSDLEAAIHLWSSPGPKDVEKPSLGNVVGYNTILNCGTDLDLKGSSATTLLSNDKSLHSKRDSEHSWKVPEGVGAALALKPTRWKWYRESGGPTGQAWIQAGPYSPVPFINYGAAYVNATSYKLWFATAPMDLHGPKWVNFKSSVDSRYVTVTLKDNPEEGSDRTAVVNFTVRHAPDQDPVSSAHELQSQMLLHFRTGTWKCKWFAWSNLSYDDRQGWLYLFSSPPLAEETIPTLNADYSGRSPVPGKVGLDHYALLATRQFTFTSGIYRFSTVSDDGIRFFVDGREIISRWNHHAGTPDSVQIPLTAGSHDLRVEYCQEDGSAQLKVDWIKIRTSP